jgi:hypothetical protein
LQRGATASRLSAPPVAGSALFSPAGLDRRRLRLVPPYPSSEKLGQGQDRRLRRLQIGVKIDVRFDGPDERLDHRREEFIFLQENPVFAFGKVPIQAVYVEVLLVLLGDRIPAQNGNAHPMSHVFFYADEIVVGHDHIEFQPVFGKSRLYQRFVRTPKDEGDLGDLLEGGEGLPREEGVVLGGNHDQAGFVQVVTYECLATFIAKPDSEIRLRGFDFFIDHLPDAPFQMKGHLGVQPPEVYDIGRQDGVDDHMIRDDDDLSPVVDFLILEFALEPLHVLEERNSLFLDYLSRGRDQHFAGGSVEQGDPQFFFQTLDLATDSRFLPTHGDRRLPDASLFGNAVESPQPL